MAIKSGINNARFNLLGHFYSRLSIFLSSLIPKFLRFFTRDLVCKENIILNISMKDFHDFVENSLTFIYLFLFALPMSIPDTLYMLL